MTRISSATAGGFEAAAALSAALGVLGICAAVGGPSLAQAQDPSGPTTLGPGRNEAGDQFGAALASGDFNGDGLQDLAVGVPGEASDDGANARRAGALFVYQGSASGLSLMQSLDQSTIDANEADDRFASALAVGDFDADGFDDLAVGTPGEALGNGPRSGVVYVFRGSRQGLLFGQSIQQTDVPRAPGGVPANEGQDQFGAALASGDFDADGIDDLAVGAPGEAIIPGLQIGAVFVFRGGRGQGLAGAQAFIDAPLGVEVGDGFGTALAAGDFNGDGRDDLAVGVPRKRGGAANSRAGAVALFNGAAGGLAAARTLRQDDLGNLGEANDFFGQSLAAGDFNGDRVEDLAVSLSGESIGMLQASGQVAIFRGGGTGLAPAMIIDQTDFGTNESGDRLGTALATGDVNADGFVDLMLGAPGERIQSGNVQSGAGYVFAGTASGLRPAVSLDPSRFGMPADGDRFGQTMVSLDFNGDGRADLAVGAPNRAPLGGTPRAGTVAVYRGDPQGLFTVRSLDQETVR